MSLKSSPLQNAMSNKKSVLGPMMTLKNSGMNASLEKSASAHAVALPLTSLIDAFSIIVIYLLIGTQTGGIDSDIPNRMTLPVAESGTQILHEAPTVRIENGRYFIDDQEVAVHQLGARLAQLKGNLEAEKAELIIQGDKKMTYASLDPLIRAGSEAGIQKLKFAVTPEQ